MQYQLFHPQHEDDIGLGFKRAFDHHKTNAVSTIPEVGRCSGLRGRGYNFIIFGRVLLA